MIFPKADRKPTDRGWVFIFVVLYIVIALYAYIAMTGGASSRLSSGMDFRGEVCGTGGLKTRPYLYYANPLIDDNVAWCV